jgi:outer membrane protein assembly factor BamB
MSKKFLVTVFLLVVFFSLFIIVPSAYAVDQSWGSLCHDSQNTGFAEGPAPASNHTLWTVAIRSVDYVAPIIANGKIFIVSHDNGTLYALNSTNGQEIWRNEHAFNSLFYGNTPAVADGYVYFGDGAGRIIAFDENTGKKVYQEAPTVGGRDVYGLNAADGRLFFNSLDGYVYCVDAGSGKRLWNYYISERYIAPPAVADGRVFQGAICLNESNGVVLWKSDGVYGSTPTVADGKVFLINRNDQNCSILCLNQTNGAVIWNYKLGNVSYANAGAWTCMTAVAYGKVFSIVVDRLFALNENTGEPFWITTGSVSGIPTATPVVSDYKVYAPGNRSAVCFDADTSQILWTYTFYALGNPLVVAEGKVFLKESDSLTAIGAQTLTSTPSPSETPQPTSTSPNPSIAPSPSVPEFPSWMALPLLGGFTLLSALLLRGRIDRTSSGSKNKL